VIDRQPELTGLILLADWDSAKANKRPASRYSQGSSRGSSRSSETQKCKKQKAEKTTASPSSSVSQFDKGGIDTGTPF
jgi:hypothetical protein